MDELRQLHEVYLSLLAQNQQLTSRRLNYLFNRNSPYLNRRATQIVLESAHRDDDRYLRALQRAIPYDIKRQERINIVTRIPRFFKNNAALWQVVARYVAFVITEPDLNHYELNKFEYAQFLLCFPRSACTQILDEFINDTHRIAVLAYLELHVKPTWGLYEMQQVSNAYGIIASRVPPHAMECFVRLILLSENYCYHSMMAALTPHAESGQLRLVDAIDYMRTKCVPCSDNIRIGTVDDDLKFSIEIQFVLALLNRLNVYGVDRVMRLLQKQDLVDSDVLQEVAKSHIRALETTTDNQPESHAMIFFSRQAALTKYAPEYKDRVLERVLRFGEDRLEVMNDTQCRVFCSILCTVSYPKRTSRKEGSDELFEFLFNRLMESLPKLGTNDMRQEFNNMQTILYCLHSLFSIDERRKEIMERLDPLWAHKICHAVDLHMVTSCNMKYDITRSTNRDELQKLRRNQSIINSTGQLLVYMLGLLQTDKLLLDLPHTSRRSYHRDDTFTDLFTKSLNIALTKTQTTPGSPVGFFHRKAFGLVELQFDADGEIIPEDPTIDGENNNENDSDDSDSDDEDDESDEEEEDIEEIPAENEENEGEIDLEDEDDDGDASSVASEYTIGSTDDEDDLEWEQFVRDGEAGILHSQWEVRRQENLLIGNGHDNTAFYVGVSSFVVFMASAVSTIQSSLDINDDYRLF
ncbi:hypothetical protein GCK72_023911 [Caenorhabditis remanei]|uniref:Uncharacterized protein n=1 Tax=Caenorhabditis remanei TaxID=31234 RepID=A0A6A5FYJ2_CAERE|nr:hypothetical protein GCK72_023911 [Caenorhabditis remanei]KAF1747449.1 hypothetical protein GCK72_023911 [Caenorhabditis remanei]